MTFNSLWRRLRRNRHPCDRGWLTEWEVEQINYWLRHHARRRHTEPFNKTRRGRLRRIERRFILRQQTGDISHG